VGDKTAISWTDATCYRSDVEDLVCQLAQEVAALAENFATVARWAESACQVLIDLGDEYEEHASGMIEDIAQLRKDGAP
jgi:hypothetical protein